MPILFAPSGSIARPTAPALCALALVACSSATSPTVDIPAPTAAPTVAAPVVRPAGPIVLFASLDEFNHPVLRGSTDLDGKAGREVWITSTFVEGIEGSVVTSAISERVIALREGTAEEIGSFGCRMF